MTKLVIACNYSPLPECNGVCDRCKHLTSIKIIDLNSTTETAIMTAANRHAANNGKQQQITTTTKYNKKQTAPMLTETFTAEAHRSNHTDQRGEQQLSPLKIPSFTVTPKVTGDV